MFLRIILAATLLSLLGCSDFISPVKSTPEPTEYSFNYWLLQRVYLYEDELSNLPATGDSIQDLYNSLEDRYTTYTPPSKSEERSTQINTSLVIGGDVGMRYYNNWNLEHPIIITRVYPKGPAGKAGVPRFGNILSANDIELAGVKARVTYDSILSYSRDIELLIAFEDNTTLYKLKKETVYAPTVFVDTLFSDSKKGYPGIVFITIEGFKATTADQDLGTYGELKAYLDSTTSEKRVRILDLRGNPGGIVNQCVAMADLFVSKGVLSIRHQRLLNADGDTETSTTTISAKAGDSGESGKFLIFGNGGSASCSEIFIAAVTETTDIPFIGATTYGKGIGQTNFNTYAGGLATITNFEFLTPKGNSYHKKGIKPKYECTGAVDENCAAKIANKLYGVKIPKQSESLAKQSNEFVYYSKIPEFEGGAIEWASKSTYLKMFKDSHP
jgi:C-terminal peptidase prc